MQIYCKFLDDETFELLKQMMAEGVQLTSLPREAVVPDDVSLLVIPTKADIKRLPFVEIEKNPPILCWDTLDAYLQEISWTAYCEAEQYYLEYALEKANRPSTDTVILGSSYAKYGLWAPGLGASCVNLGLDAQDIYYTCKLAETVIRRNPNLRHIVLASGYYWFYSDISRADSAYARGLIRDTYYPVLKDALHAGISDAAAPDRMLLEELSFLDEHRVLEHYCRQVSEQMGGESVKITRSFAFSSTDGWRICNRCLRELSDQRTPGEFAWKMLPPSVKDVFAQARCRDHNKLLRHVESYRENSAVLKDFVSYCNEKKINVYILCMPQTEYYLRHLDPRLKEDYFAALDAVEGEYHFLDFHEVSLLQPEDYIDQDHLSPSGAKKTTAILKELIETCGK